MDDPAPTSAAEAPANSGWDWASRGSSHVDFRRNEVVPLAQGAFLGHGVNGPVYETSCNGQTVALKKVFCRSGIKQTDLKEIEIIKKLRHHHVIELVGTYTHGLYLGLLLYPVAVCDLATFLEDVNTIWTQSKSDRNYLDSSQFEEVLERFQRLGVDCDFVNGRIHLDIECVQKQLSRSLGCITSAIVFLHDRKIRHKDLKPSNILIYPSGLRITDFGTSTDFSALTRSTTAGDERGTPIYFAPEVAEYLPVGRSADIFSLGCIFLEIIVLAIGTSLTEFRALRIDRDHSFHANLNHINEWFGQAAFNSYDQCLLGVARYMIHSNPSRRPSASDVRTYLRLIDGFRFCHIAGRRLIHPLHDHCCSEKPVLPEVTGPLKAKAIEVEVGNFHTPDARHSSFHDAIFFVRTSRDDIIEQVHIFLVSTTLLFLEYLACGCCMVQTYYSA
jgi:serine/threonine protein kinase